MIRLLAGAVASCLMLVTGLWLILAPFALDVQPQEAAWRAETFTDVWTGIGLAALGAIGVIAFTAALLRHLHDRGLLRPRPGYPAPVPAAVSATSAAPSNELDTLLAPLVTALARDLARDHDNDRQAPYFGESGPAGISRYPRNSQTPAPSGQQRETSR